MTTIQQEFDHCIIRQIEHGIHEFRWQSTERAAVDMWMDYNDKLYSQSQPDDKLYFLHVIDTPNFPPLSYLVRKARQLQMKHPQQPSTRSAMLFEARFFAGFVNTLSVMLNRKGKDQTRFFALKEREKAIDWLLSAE